MSDIRWIKITTDIFDDEKILLIESMPDADSLIVIWFKLLCLAGRSNNNGVFLLNDRIAYTDQMLATIFRRKESKVRMALETFEQFGMIELIDGVITIPNWEKHQNIEGMEKIREQNRLRKQRQREKDRLLSVTHDGHVLSRDSHATDKEEDKEKEKDKDKEERIDFQSIVSMYNEICVSFPTIRSLSDARKKAIKARMKTYNVDDFELLFRKAEASDFLKGKNDRNWSATFDWLISDRNFAKVLDGNYDNRTTSSNHQSRTAQQMDDTYRMMAGWANDES